MLFNVVHHSAEVYHLCPPPTLGRKEQDNGKSYDLLGAKCCAAPLSASPAVQQSGPRQERGPNPGASRGFSGGAPYRGAGR